MRTIINKILSKSVVGVDISECAIRVVLLQKKSGVVSLQKAMQTPLFKNEAGVLEALKTLKNRMGVKKANIVFAVSESQVSSHCVALQEVSASSDVLMLEEAVLAELEEQFHHSVDEFYMDFKLLDSTNAEEMRFEVKCIAKEKVEPYLQGFKEIHWKPLIMDIDTPVIDSTLRSNIKNAPECVIEGGLCNYDKALSLALRGLESLC